MESYPGSLRCRGDENEKGRRGAGLSETFASSVRRSVLRNHRATAPIETIVDAGLDGVLVVVERTERREGSRRHERAVAEIVVLILELGRPARGEHVFQTAADGVAVLVVMIEGERHRRTREGQPVVGVGPGITALDVQQRRTPGVADPGGRRTDRALVVVVDETSTRAGEGDGVVVVAEPAVLGFDTEHPARRELIVGAALHATEEAAVIAVVGEAAETVVAGKRAADVAADVETGPVVDRRRIGRSLGVGPRRQIGCKCWHGRAESDEGHSSEQKLLHCTCSPDSL